MNKSIINGKQVGSDHGASLKVLDKYTGSMLAVVPYIDNVDMKNAISGSVKAHQKLKKMSAGQRSELLYNFRDLLQKNFDKLARLICSEAGKPISYAKAEVKRSISTLTLSAEEAKRFCGEVVPMDFDNAEGKEAYTKRFPLGVIGAISPFNFPINLALHKIGPALAAGNSIILKPSPYTPLSAILLGQLALESGFPDGALNIVICEIPVAEILIKDSMVNMISFTGSPSVGWNIKSLARKKKVVLELGGNASVIIDSSTDLEVAAKAVATGAFLYAGQICISTQKVMVEETVYDDFSKLLISETKKLIVGDCHKEETIVGPLIDKVHLQRINSWVDEAVKNGAKCVYGGKILDEKKNIYMPTILENVNKEMKVSCEEVFGPVVCLYKTKDFEESISLTNDSKFGLQAGVFTELISQMKQAFNELEVGGVIINGIPGFRIDHMPYGGIKDSGLGREGVRYAIEDMSEVKLMVY